MDAVQLVNEILRYHLFLVHFLQVVNNFTKTEEVALHLIHLSYERGEGISQLVRNGCVDQGDKRLLCLRLVVEDLV
jgi:hypothetical protein